MHRNSILYRYKIIFLKNFKILRFTPNLQGFSSFYISAYLENFGRLNQNLSRMDRNIGRLVVD